MANIEQQETSESRQDTMREQSRNASAPSPRESAAEQTLSKQVVEKSAQPQLAKIGTQAQQGLRNIRTVNTQNTRTLVLGVSGIAAGLVVYAIVRRRQKQENAIGRIQNIRIQRNIQDAARNFNKSLNTLLNNIKSNQGNANKIMQGSKKQVQDQQAALLNMKEGMQKSLQNIKLPPLLKVILLARIVSLLKGSKGSKLQGNKANVRNRAANNLQNMRRTSATLLSRLRVFVAGIATGYTWVYLFGSKETKEVVNR